MATIIEAKEKAEALEEAIADLMTAYTQATGATVTGITCVAGHVPASPPEGAVGHEEYRICIEVRIK